MIHLLSLLSGRALKPGRQEERFNRKFVLADGRSVSYAIAGAPDGLPVFLFLVCLCLCVGEREGEREPRGDGSGKLLHPQRTFRIRMLTSRIWSSSSIMACCTWRWQGLDAHRHAAAHFEDSAKRRGIRLICFDRPGRGGSDPIPPVSPVNVGDGEKDAHQVACTATEEAVVDVVKQVSGVLGEGARKSLRASSTLNRPIRSTRRCYDQWGRGGGGWDGKFVASILCLEHPFNNNFWQCVQLLEICNGEHSMGYVIQMLADIRFACVLPCTPLLCYLSKSPHSVLE